MHSKNRDKLVYRVSDQHGALIITLVGSLACVNGLLQFEHCLDEVERKEDVRSVILDFRKVSSKELDVVLIPVLAKLKTIVRGKSAPLIVASAHPDIRAFFIDHGLFIESDFTNSLKEVLKNI